MQLTYLGTNTLLLRKPGAAVLVDPHFTRPSKRVLFGKIRPNPQAVAAGLAACGVDRLDGLLLTHTHYDHALDAPEVLRQVGGTLYGSESANNLAIIPGEATPHCVSISAGSTYQVGDFRVSFHPSRHLPFPAPVRWLMPPHQAISQPLATPAPFWHYRSGRVLAIQVDHTLIFGSAGFVPGAYQGLGIKTVVLGIGGLDLQSSTYLENFYHQAVQLSGANTVYLSHWDDFFLPVSQGLKPHVLTRRANKRIRALAAASGHRVQHLRYGKTITL